jgi:hypothetical protein
MPQNPSDQIASQVKELKKAGPRFNKQEYIAIAQQPKATVKKAPKKRPKRAAKRVPSK